MAPKTLNLTYAGDASKVTKSLGEIEKKTGDLGNSLTKTGDKMSSVGKKMSIGLTAPIAALGVVAFKAASNAGEALSKVNVVFGESAKEIEEWAKTAAKSMGISRREALEAAGTFGNLFRAMNVDTKAATAMSKGVIELASDLASFNDANPEDVLIALKSGLVGETEPLRAFGVNLNAARIQAEAFSSGLVKAPKSLAKIKLAEQEVTETQLEMNKAVKAHGKESTQAAQATVKFETASKALEKALEGETVELDAGQKAQAAYQLIMKDTTLAQGDFARTADGAANMQRSLKAQFDDTAVVIGEKLLPIGIKILGFVSDLIGKFTALPEPTQNAILVMMGIAAVSGPILGVTGNIIGLIGKIQALGTTAATTGAAVGGGAGAVGTGAAAASLAGGLLAAAGAGVILGIGLNRLIEKHIPEFNDTLEAFGGWIYDKAIPGLEAFGGAIYDWFIAPLSKAIGMWKELKKDLFEGMAKGIGKSLAGPLAPLLGLIPGLQHGGIVTRPTLAMVGEGGPEAVIPLNQVGGMGGVTIVFNQPIYGTSGVREVTNMITQELRRQKSRGGVLGLA